MKNFNIMGILAGVFGHYFAYNSIRTCSRFLINSAVVYYNSVNYKLIFEWLFYMRMQKNTEQVFEYDTYNSS